MSEVINGIAQPDVGGVKAATAIAAKRFVAADAKQAAVDSLTVIGVAPNGIPNGKVGQVVGAGLLPVTADAPLAAGDPVKVGVGGRATKHTTAQHVIQTAIAGEASAFTQPASAVALEVVQAAHVAGDRGRGIVIEGSDAEGAAITETIALHATNTTTAVAGAVEFTKVCAVYMADGLPLGAQNVTVRAAEGGATVCTLPATAKELGADIPAQSQEAYCNEVTVSGPNGNESFVTIVGINSADAVARERVQLDGASPAVKTTTTVWRYINRICLGEFTNAAAGAVKTNATTDTAGMKCGVVVRAATTRGNDALVLIKPNA
jgi:hypothetical protein